MLARKLVGKRLQGLDYSSKQASRIIAGRGFRKALATAAATRLGLGSVPTALLVGGIVLARMVYARKRARQAKLEAKKPVDS